MGDMHRIKLFEFVFIAFVLSVAFAQRGDRRQRQTLSIGERRHGRDVVTNVVRAICWFEFLHRPRSDVNQFLRCDNQVQKLKSGYAEAPDMVFGGALSNTLPQWFANYMAACDPFLKSPKRPYKDGFGKTNYGFIIGERYLDSYPFQAFSHCLVAEIDKSNGPPAMLALESRLKGERYWRETMFHRENEFRARHNVSGLTLDALLTDDAQQYAEQLSRTCSFKASNPLGRDRLYDRQFTGENIAMNGGTFLKDEDAANVAVTGWYEEIVNYDFQTGASKNNFPVDQFTQSVWKGTERVGYGLGINKKCPNGYTHYIVARYFPAGNIPNGHLENVFPPTVAPKGI